MKHRIPVLLAGIVALALVVGVACSPNPDAASDGGGGTSESGDVAASGPVAVVLADFSITPSEIAIPANQATTIELTNEGQAPHSLIVDAAGTELVSEEIPAGGTGTLEIPALEAGTYDVWCGVPGHKETGMTGTLVVGGEAAAGGDTEMSGHEGMSVQQMLDGHEKGVVDFVANNTEAPITEGVGGEPLKPTMQGKTKVFELTIDEVEWQVAPGVTKTVWAYNGTVPGPEIRVQKGDHIRVHVTNNIDEPTTVHFHGVRVPNPMDGVPFVTQDPIMTGGEFDYEFTVHDNPGLYLYHSHFDSAAQVDKGLYGGFVVEDPDKKSYDVEYTDIIGDGYLGFNINGKGFPATGALVAKKGETVLLHLANIGQIIHPMHMHGYDFEVIRQDGEELPEPYLANTLMIAPGNTYDVLIHADKPGVWAYHCHILTHVEGADGMFGMVTALIVQ